MDALVMCGGRGTRLETDVEKPRYEVGGEPMVDRVCDALAESRIDTVYAVVSPWTPNTRAHLRGRMVDTIETAGEGYVADLDRALDDERIDPPVLTAVADLPLLAGQVVDRVLDEFDDRDDATSLTACVPAALKRELGVSIETTTAHGGCELAPTGLNVVGADGSAAEALMRSHDARLAVNVNRLEDAAVAEALVCD